MVEIPILVNTNMIAHEIMTIMAAKVTLDETHVLLKQGLHEFREKESDAILKEFDVLQLKQVFVL